MPRPPVGREGSPIPERSPSLRRCAAQSSSIGTQSGPRNDPPSRKIRPRAPSLSPAVGHEPQAVGPRATRPRGQGLWGHKARGLGHGPRVADRGQWDLGPQAMRHAPWATPWRPGHETWRRKSLGQGCHGSRAPGHLAPSSARSRRDPNPRGVNAPCPSPQGPLHLTAALTRCSRSSYESQHYPEPMFRAPPPPASVHRSACYRLRPRATHECAKVCHDARSAPRPLWSASALAPDDKRGRPQTRASVDVDGRRLPPQAPRERCLCGAEASTGPVGWGPCGARRRRGGRTRLQKAVVELTEMRRLVFELPQDLLLSKSLG